MESLFNDLTQIRKNYIEILHQFDLDQLIYIPDGFENNIFWNCAHALVTQQLMTYYLTDNKMLVSNEWIIKYKKGSFGNDEVSEEDVRLLVKLLQSTSIQLRKDYNSEKLAYFRPYQTSFGINLESVEDAIRFNNLHESMHLGYVKAMIRLIQ